MVNNILKFGVHQFNRLLVVASFSVVVSFLMGFSDQIVAGNKLGESALSGIGLVAPFVSLSTFLANLVGVGMGVLVSTELGACNTKRAHQIFAQGVWTACCVAVGYFLCLALFKNFYLSFMATGVEVTAYASSYWNWFKYAAFLEMVVVILVQINMVDGDSKRCFIANVVMLTVNFTVAICTVKPLGTGGCALGTVVANACGILILCGHLFGKTNSFKLEKYFAFRDTWGIFKSSFGDASSFLCMAALSFFLNKFVIAHFGESWLPVLATVVATIGFLEIFNGIGNALGPIVTVYVGEENTHAVRKMMNIAQIWAIAEGCILTLIFVIYPQLVVKMIGITNPNVASLAAQAVRIVTVGFVFYALVYLYNSYYIFVGRSLLSISVTILNGLLMPMLLVFLVGWKTPQWTWLALAIAPFLAMSLFGLFIRFRFGKGMFPLILMRNKDANIFMFDLLLEPEAIVQVATQISDKLKSRGAKPEQIMRASLMTEEVLMAVRDRNQPRKVLAEVTLDLNQGVVLTLRDDGEIFDITDSDQQISSLRTYLVASVMERQANRMNILTTGFNRNVFKF